MSVIAPERYVYTTIELPNWQTSIPIAFLKSNRAEQYLPFRSLCQMIGVERKRQLSIIKVRYHAALKSLPLESATGAHLATWIRRHEAVDWITTITPGKCKLATREALERFRAELAEAADHLLFDKARVAPAKRGMFAHSERSEYVFSCLYCGGGHRIIAQNGEVTLEKFEY